MITDVVNAWHKRIRTHIKAVQARRHATGGSRRCCVAMTESVGRRVHFCPCCSCGSVIAKLRCCRRGSYSCVRGHFRFDRGLPDSASLGQSEWNHADGQKQKYVKRASAKMSFDGGIILFFHRRALVGPVTCGASFVVQCAQKCQDIFDHRVFSVNLFVSSASHPPKKQGTRELPREFPLYFFLTFNASNL